MKSNNFTLLCIFLLILISGLTISNGQGRGRGRGRGVGPVRGRGPNPGHGGGQYPNPGHGGPGRGQGPNPGHGGQGPNPGHGGPGHGQGPNPGHGQQNSCPQLEAISREITWRRVAANPALAPKLLRMQFHDCFIRGCDASILLDSTNIPAEKEAIPNQSILGYDVIDEIKAKLEEECPGQISCADIIALASRDAISFQFKRPLWPVFIGRKDGRFSSADEANKNLPSPFAGFATLKQQFQSHGLNVTDLVALSGSHTIGLGHCNLIGKRLFDFTGKNDTDPSLDKDYANFLKQKCQNPPNNPNTTTLEMDPGSAFSFDSHYFVALNQNKGLFQSDTALLTDPEAAQEARIFENQQLFFTQFAISVVKMGSIGGNVGEIRNKCHVVN